jgi:hypothetical protein
MEEKVRKFAHLPGPGKETVVLGDDESDGVVEAVAGAKNGNRVRKGS